MKEGGSELTGFCHCKSLDNNIGIAFMLLHIYEERERTEREREREREEKEIQRKTEVAEIN